MQILFNGLCNGALIALLAMAFVIVYLPTKVFYIALAGVYVLGAYLTKQLMAWGLPWPLAVLGALAAGVGVSLLCDLLNHRPLEMRRSSLGAHMISSLGIYMILVQVVALVWGNDPQVLKTGIGGVWRVRGLVMAHPQIGRCSGLKPSAVVLVATIRALKAHGGAPAVKAGMPLDSAYTHENLSLLKMGCENMLAHIDIVKKSGIRPVVCLNAFHTDTTAEMELVRDVATTAGALFAVSDHWMRGGEGALDLAAQVVMACDEVNDFHYLSPLTETLTERICRIATEVYGGDGVDFSDEAIRKLSQYEKTPEVASLPICMAKTQYSLSHDPTLLGRPKGWRLPVRDIMVYFGAGIVVPITGSIKLMPGSVANAAYRRIDVDTRTGKVKGLF